MKLKLFLASLMLGLSLHAQTNDGLDPVDELDVVEQTDTTPPVTEVVPDVPVAPVPPVPPLPPTPPAAPAPVAKPAAVSAPVVGVAIPRVFQTLMPNKKQHEWLPYITSIGTNGTDKRNEDVTYINSVVLSGLSYSYGITENQSISANLNYKTRIERVNFGTNESSTKRKGLANPLVNYKGLVNFFGVSFFAHIGYSFKLEKETYDTDTQEGNSSTGQNSLTYSIGGYKKINSDLTVGANVNYIRALDGEIISKSTTNSETIKITKGDYMKTSVFIEFENEWRPNLSLFVEQNFSKEYTDEFDTKSYSLNSQFLGLGFSGQFQTGKSTYFIPQLSYASALNENHIDNYTSFVISGALRLLY